MRTIVPWRLGRKPVTLGMISAGLAAICYGSSQFLARRLVTQYAPPLVVASLATLTGMVILGTLSNKSLVKDRRAPKRTILFMVLAGFAASSGTAFSFSALRLAPVIVVSPITSINPLVALALAHLFLQRVEKVTFRIWAGAALVVSGIILVTLGSV